MEMIPTRSLLNPKFDGYKLHLVEQHSAVRSYPLQHTATQSTASPHALLSFQDVQGRITHNHLAVSNDEPNRGFALYVDADYNVVVIEVDPVSLIPECRAVYELPKPVFSASSAGNKDYAQYPSAAFLDPTTVFVLDGHGYVYVLSILQGQSARLLGQYRLQQSSQPFRIHNAVTVSQERAVVLLSSKCTPSESITDAPKSQSRRPPPEYDVWAVQFTLPFDMVVESTQDLDVLWQRRGEDIPVYTAFDDSRQTFLLVGSTIYREIGAPPVPSYEPSPDEIAPIPQKDEASDAKLPTPTKPPPYSWTQTSDSVTVAFPLPSTTPKTAIKVTFTPRTLTLHIQSQSAESTILPLPHYSLKSFWDGIQPSSSFWTWDREGEHAYGLLTLHLDKQHEGTRWMHVFAAPTTTTTPAADDAKEEDVEVPETLDPSELELIREALEKYTSSLRDGGDASGLGLGKGVPSLAEGEMDDEVDASVGREVYVTPVGQLLTTGDASASSTSSTVRVRASDVPFVLLSTPLPGSTPQRVSLVVKTSLDGALFRLDPHETAADSHPDDGNLMATALRWTHTATYSALAFVLASKQDTRFTHHVGAKAVLAFESGSAGRGQNVYIYRGARASETWAKQSVLRIGDATGGSLLGVGAVKVTGGKQVILCLTERQLVIVSNVI